MPVRYQRKRHKGWRKKPNTVYIGRPSRWGNPFEVGKTTVLEGGKHITPQDKEHCVMAFRWWVSRFTPEEREKFLAPLKGKNLMCWCREDEPCHGDVLLELANPEEMPLELTERILPRGEDIGWWRDIGARLKCVWGWIWGK